MNNRIRKFFGGVTLLASVSLSVLVQAQGLTDVLNQARATREAEIALFLISSSFSVVRPKIA